MFLNNQWTKEEIRKEIIKHLGMSNNENTIYQNLGDAAKTGLWEKPGALNAYMKREERSQINNQTLHIKELEEVPKLK